MFLEWSVDSKSDTFVTLIGISSHWNIYAN